ncbi:NusA-like transcription termination signal-binding factor [Thermofilum pendens]|uniref:Probable transcription termination protein NusA n=1 Tax=Thermofilum pendens (strain DSM 2475 / Hrk 5) TaxID=368408 RepID=A1RWW2_THEPD|nr:NusA-like transcription termination signal-binding factor [Thermofilum pendens]ABL77692.1 NusA family KH domain protein [Thermofilum pendens Hrk 5]
MTSEEGRRLTHEDLQIMNLFEEITKVPPKDIVYDDTFQRYIFLVDKGFAPLAVGKNGSKIRMIKELLRKDVEVVEDGSSLEDFVKSVFFPARVVEVKVREENNRKVVIAVVPPDQLGLAIGRNGRNVQRAKILLKRYYGADEVRVQRQG